MSRFRNSTIGRFFENFKSAEIEKLPSGKSRKAALLLNCQSVILPGCLEAAVAAAIAAEAGQKQNPDQDAAAAVVAIAPEDTADTIAASVAIVSVVKKGQQKDDPDEAACAVAVASQDTGTVVVAATVTAAAGGR